MQVPLHVLVQSSMPAEKMNPQHTGAQMHAAPFSCSAAPGGHTGYPLEDASAEAELAWLQAVFHKCLAAWLPHVLADAAELFPYLAQALQSSALGSQMCQTRGLSLQ